MPLDSIRDQLQSALGDAYLLDRELGGGGMSRVFVAEETALGRQVVVKVLSADLLEGLSVDRFTREIRLAATLQEPHIVPLLAAGITPGGLPYYTMPFVRGESLRARLGRGPLAREEAARILRDIACALAYAHTQGVVHRDIKPENILLHEGTAVVTDFGIAKAMRASKTPQPSGGTLTSVGTSLGTPAYMAPEQAAGDDVDHRADLYAWGVVAYELLAGRHPFADKKTAQQLVAAHIAEHAAPLGAVVRGVAPALSAAVMRTLEKDPALRPQSAAELVTAVDAGLAQDARNYGVATQRAFWRSSPRAVVSASLALALVGVVVVVWASRRNGGSRGDIAPPREAPTVSISTLAVVPFVNLGGDEYFSDGMTDELSHALATLPGLRLAGRSSVYAFKGKNRPASEIGRALGVGALVLGTVQRASDRVRLRAQLVATADDEVLWSETFERSSGDVFALQDSLTAAVVAAIAPALRGERAGAVSASSRGTFDTAAYDLYLRGQYLWRRRGAENLVTAADFFRRAVARDPRFARGHSGLALTLGVLPFYGAANPDSLARLALASADHALELDSALAEAHLARGRALHGLMRLSEAATEYTRTLAIDPRSASALQWLGEIVFNAGLLDSGVAIERRAQAMDPASPIPGWLIARQLTGMGRVAEAVVEAKRARDLDPALSRPRIALGAALVLAGQLDSALVELEGVHRRTPEEPGAVAYLAYAYAAAGRWDDVHRLHAEETARGRNRASHAQLAAIALLLGDRSTALAELRASLVRHDLIPVTVFPGCEPLFASLRTDARFRALLSDMGVVQCAGESRWPVPRHPRGR